MAEVGKYLVIIAGLSILLTFAGFDTGIGLVLGDLLTNPESVTTSSLFLKAAGLLAIIAGAGIAIGFITGSSSVEAIALAGYATILINFVSDIIIVLTYARGTYGSTSWEAGVLALVMIPLAILYTHSVVSWWGQR